MITLDVPNRRLHVELTDDELQRRKQVYKPQPPATERGYVSLYLNHVQQAHLGADMDFLTGSSGSEVLRTLTNN